MEEFFEVLRNYRRLGVWAVGGSAGVPFASSLIGMQPPNPEGIIVVTAIFQLIVTMFVYQAQYSLSRRRVNKRMLASLIAFSALIVSYVFLFQLLVVEGPGGQRFVAGLKCTSNALLVYAESCPFLDVAHLEDVAFREGELWTRTSLALSNVLLVVVWSSVFVCLSWLVASFLVYNTKNNRA